MSNDTPMSFKCLTPVFFTIVLMLVSCREERQNAAQQTNLYQAADSRGRQISLNRPAARVVVLFEPMVDELFMLGANDCIIGIPEQVYQNKSSYTFFSKLDERIARKSVAAPTFGGRANNVESIIGLRPDLAIVYEQERETIKQLEDLNIPVYAVSSKNKERIYAELRGVATLLNKRERSEELISFVEENLSRMTRPIGKAPKKIYYAWSKGRILSTSGKGSLIDLSIEAAGAENACPLPMEAPNIGAEMLYKWNPDMIILWNSLVDDVYKLKELAALPAVKNKQVYVLSPSFHFDPHTIKFMLFAKQLQQWCYADSRPADWESEIEKSLDKLYDRKNQEAK